VSVSVVLVLTHQFDPTADQVVKLLNTRNVSVFRCDIGQFPLELTATAELGSDGWEGNLALPGRVMSLDSVAGVYYRRPTGFQMHDGMSAEEHWWSVLQARLGFGGLLASIDQWLNHPHQISYSEYKPVQLKTARRCGFTVPRTLITNDPVAARKFVRSVETAVCKPFGSTSIVDTEGVYQFFSTVIDHTRIDESVRHTMHMFQAWADKKYEVRLTVVDDRMFAARIDASSEAGYRDWRSDYRRLTYSVCAVPDSVRVSITRFMNTLHLRFGAFDFVVSSGGEWQFLECNPNGQWSWIEDETGLPISEALADALAGRR
jgi:ATP-grasp ribosomal peptide maturase